jgi:hypothetical protein
MNEAALRYSPEMALAFQPTDTDLPTTKKSCAVLDRFADQKPTQMVAMTVRALKVRIQRSMVIEWRGLENEKEGKRDQSISRVPWLKVLANVERWSNV